MGGERWERVWIEDGEGGGGGGGWGLPQALQSLFRGSVVVYA